MTNKKKIGITLSKETEKSLEIICEKLGLSKSNAIAYAVNTTVMEKFIGKEQKAID